MEKRPVVMIVGGGGGAPTIPEKMVGKPGLQDCAGECTGKMYSYMGSSFTPDALRAGHNPGRKPQRKATSQAQQAFMGAELQRMREGKKTRTGMSEAQLAEFASTKASRLPRRAKKT
jgi:hypothetical protein